MEEYKNKVDFIIVYISEAHPSDGEGLLKVQDFERGGKDHERGGTVTLTNSL